MEEVLDHLRARSEKDQIRWLQEKSKEVSDFYKISVEEIERSKAEFRLKNQIIQKKVEKKQSEIDAVKQTIDNFMAEKDFSQFQAEKQTFFDSPSIRVKDMVEVNTIIKGKKASMTIEEDIFGVKFKEVKDGRTNEYKIMIDGFYS